MRFDKQYNNRRVSHQVWYREENVICTAELEFFYNSIICSRLDFISCLLLHKNAAVFPEIIAIRLAEPFKSDIVALDELFDRIAALRTFCCWLQIRWGTCQPIIGHFARCSSRIEPRSVLFRFSPAIRLEQQVTMDMPWIPIPSIVNLIPRTFTKLICGMQNLRIQSW
jgi:hypothetical protein